MSISRKHVQALRFAVDESITWNGRYTDTTDQNAIDYCEWRDEQHKLCKEALRELYKLTRKAHP